jgi:hypothetical protein
MGNAYYPDSAIVTQKELFQGVDILAPFSPSFDQALQKKVCFKIIRTFGQLVLGCGVYIPPCFFLRKT